MLLGRDRELGAITKLIEEARAGSSAVLAFVGEPGIGKSALLEWTAEHATGMTVLRARGVESEAHIPFAGLFELLRPALRSVDRLPDHQAVALESALALRPAEAHDRFAVGAATLSLLAAYAEHGPLLVLLDDVHWLDGSSADAIRFAVRRLFADPIAVLVTGREGEASLLDGSGLTIMRVEGLDAGTAAELLRRQVPETSDESAARLYRETGGNPLALLELARVHPDDIPLDTPVPALTSVAAAYLERASALDDNARATLVVAAASDGADLTVVARAAAILGLDIAGLVEAEERGLVSIGAGRIEFRHPLTRSAIYGAASPETRRSAHRALADALPDVEGDRRAWHLALAATGPDDRASSALEQAGRRARERSAYDVASRAYERGAALAHDPSDRVRLVYAAADAAWLGGLGTRTLSLLDAAAYQAADVVLLDQIDHLRGHVGLRQGPLGEARSILTAAAERASARAPETAVVMLAEAAEGAFFAADGAGARECGQRAEDLAARLPDERSRFFGQFAAGMGQVLTGDGESGSALIRRAAAVLERVEDLESDPRLLAWSVVAPLWLREADADGAYVDRAIATARARSAVGVLPHLLGYVGVSQVGSARYVEAQATLDEAVRLARETEQLTVLILALARLAGVEARIGRAAQSRDHADEALALAREVGVHLAEIWALTALGELELAAGETGAALLRFDALQDVLDTYAIGDPDLSPAPERVELLLRDGRVDEANAVAGPFVDAATAKSQPWALARAARTRALLAGADEFETIFEEALADHARTPDTFERGRTLLAYGARMRRAGQRVRARERLRGALDVFDDLGTEPWGDAARTELAATGETARRRNPSTLGDLTPQELQISLMLAAGKTTREAAAALFLSPKTIEYHLRNVYRKLNVRSRRELAEALARLR